MMIRQLATAALILVSLGTAAAQEGDGGEISASQGVTFSANGFHSVSVKPERVRILVPLIAHALSTEEAIDLLRERKEAARERVRGLGADLESIRFGSVGIEDSRSLVEAGRSMFGMINGPGNTVDLEQLPVLYTARADMTVDWQLPPADSEAMLAFAEQVVGDLKEPDLTGKDDRPEFSPNVEEVLEGLRDQSARYFSGNRQDPDAIRYMFVAKVTEATSQEAVRGAYEDARSHVEAMTAAAGLEMGKLTSMAASRLAAGYHTGFGLDDRQDMLTPGPDEVGETRAGDLEYVAQVQAQFVVAQ